MDAWGESIFLISLSERGSAREPPSCCLGEELLKIFSRGQAPFSWITSLAPHEFWVLVREIPEEENKEHFREVFFRCPRRSVQGLVSSLFFCPPMCTLELSFRGGGAFWVSPSGAPLVTPRFLLSRVFKLGLEISVNEPRGFFFSPLGSLSPPSSTHASHSPQWVYGRGSWG